MLTFILIGGLVWLTVAMVLVLALAAAARKQVSPVAVNSSIESHAEERPPAPTPEPVASQVHHSPHLGDAVVT